MIIRGQTYLHSVPTGIFPDSFRESLRSCWIETAEEFFALAPILDSVDPEFREKWEEIEDYIKNSEEEKLGVLRHLATEWTSGSPPPERPLGDTVSQQNLDLYRSHRELRHENQVTPLPLQKSLPTSFCLAEKFPQRFGAIIDQKENGECVACTVTSLVEFIKERPEPLSAKFLYQECKKRDGHLGKRGTDLSTAEVIVAEIGICPEHCFLIDDDSFQEPDDKQCHAEAVRYQMKHSRPILLGNKDHIKAILTGNGGVQPMPIATTLLVFDSWYCSRSTSRTGKWTLPLPGEMPKSCSHAVLIIGYQDGSAPGGGYFIARNSWGGSWGNNSPIDMNGHALIPYAYVQRFACDALTGQEILIDNFERKYCHILQENDRNKRDYNGQIRRVGTKILRNPVYPDDFMLDTDDNRRQFEEWKYICNENKRYDLVKKTIEERYQLGQGKLGHASICVRHIEEDTGFSSEEVKKWFDQLVIEGYGTYSIYETINGIAIDKFWDVYGRDVKKADDIGWTSLHWAALLDRNKIVEDLWRRGAEVNAKNVIGETPLDLAKKMGNARVIECLQKIGGKSSKDL